MTIPLEEEQPARGPARLVGRKHQAQQLDGWLRCSRAKYQQFTALRVGSLVVRRDTSTAFPIRQPTAQASSQLDREWNFLQRLSPLCSGVLLTPAPELFPSGASGCRYLASPPMPARRIW